MQALHKEHEDSTAHQSTCKCHSRVSLAKGCGESRDFYMGKLCYRVEKLVLPLKLILLIASHSSPSGSLLLNIGGARLITNAHTGFNTGVTVSQCHMNIITIWAGSRNSHPKDNVSGSPKN